MEFSESDSDVASTMSYTVENANAIVEEIAEIANSLIIPDTKLKNANYQTKNKFDEIM